MYLYGGMVRFKFRQLEGGYPSVWHCIFKSAGTVGCKQMARQISGTKSVQFSYHTTLLTGSLFIRNAFLFA